LSGRGLCDEPITRPEESYRLCYVVVCDLETSRIGAPYIYDISNLRVKLIKKKGQRQEELITYVFVQPFACRITGLYYWYVFVMHRKK